MACWLTIWLTHSSHMNISFLALCVWRQILPVDGKWWQMVGNWNADQKYFWSIFNYVSSKKFQKKFNCLLNWPDIWPNLHFPDAFLVHILGNFISQAYISLTHWIFLHIFCLGMLEIDNGWSDMAWLMNCPKMRLSIRPLTCWSDDW